MRISPSAAETERWYGHCRKRSGEHRTAPAAGLPPVLLEARRRTRCGCSRREKRFLNLNVRGREPLPKFSNKMSNALANREFLAIRCIPTAASCCTSQIVRSRTDLGDRQEKPAPPARLFAR